MIRSARSIIVASLVIAASSAASAATITLASPPIQPDSAASSIFDAKLAIGRASLLDPRRAERGAAPYAAALQAYNAGNLDGAEQSATAALVAIDQPSAPQATSDSPVVSPPAPAQYPGLVSVSEGESEERLLALTLRDAHEAGILRGRRALLSCGAVSATAFTTAKPIFDDAVRNEQAHHPAAVTADSKTIVNDCAAAIPTASGMTTNQ
jgi:hypothetical protein